MWLITTENIFLTVAVEVLDNEAMKGYRSHVFQELIIVLRCCILHNELSLSLQEQQNNFKISIRKYRVVSWWEEKML